MCAYVYMQCFRLHFFGSLEYTMLLFFKKHSDRYASWKVVVKTELQIEVEIVYRLYLIRPARVLPYLLLDSVCSRASVFPFIVLLTRLSDCGKLRQIYGPEASDCPIFAFCHRTALRTQCLSLTLLRLPSFSPSTGTTNLKNKK